MRDGKDAHKAYSKFREHYTNQITKAVVPDIKKRLRLCALHADVCMGILLDMPKMASAVNRYSREGLDQLNRKLGNARALAAKQAELASRIQDPELRA